MQCHCSEALPLKRLESFLASFATMFRESQGSHGIRSAVSRALLEAPPFAAAPFGRRSDNAAGHSRAPAESPSARLFHQAVLSIVLQCQSHQGELIALLTLLKVLESNRLFSHGRRCYRCRAVFQPLYPHIPQTAGGPLCRIDPPQPSALLLYPSSIPVQPEPGKSPPGPPAQPYRYRRI